MELNSRFGRRCHKDGKACTVRYKSKQAELDDSCVAIQRFSSEVVEAKGRSEMGVARGGGRTNGEKGGTNVLVAIRVTKTYIDAGQDDGENAFEPTETVTVM